MVELSSETDTVLQFQCPRCGQLERDEYEVLSVGTPHDWRCGACSKLLGVLIRECDLCGAESVTVALAASELPVVTCLPCTGCGRSGEHHEQVE